MMSSIASISSGASVRWRISFPHLVACRLRNDFGPVNYLRTRESAEMLRFPAGEK